jgi:hypothetical protein
MRIARLAFACACLLAWGSVMALEEPRFEKLESEGSFELRRYAPYIVAETVVTTDFSSAGNEGFRRLARYIFGGNRSRTRIAMTAPVSQSTQGEKIAMTAPVGQRAAAEGYVVSFTMPSKYTLETLPQPEDSRVVLRKVPGFCAGVLRYSGSWSEARYATRLGELRNWLGQRGVETSGEPILARYNPPWIPGPFRRNEILQPVVCPG